MIGEAGAFLCSPCLQLFGQGFGIYPDAHGGDFQSLAQNIVPDQNVAVQRPIVIVGSTAVEGMMLKLKLQYFGCLMRRVDSLEKTLMLGGLGAEGEGDDRG